MKKFVKISMICAVCFTNTVKAGITISSMIDFVENGVSEFTITNNDPYRQFINVQVKELKIDEQGELIKIPYSRENIDIWSVSSTPARGIIEPKAKKAFRIKYEPLPSHDENKDKIYQVSFIPTPYLGEGEKVNNSVQMAVGFSPFVIVPSKTDQPLSYRVKHNGKSFTVHNSGQSYIKATFKGYKNSLNSNEKGVSQTEAFILSGRQIDISLPENMQRNLSVTLSTHYAKYKDELEIKVGEEAHSKVVE
ncbi:hypothetical protein M445_12195 [Vibrio owensii 47666-1]|uniref:hypothetical protein n=1 Tax=Vibrio owensii TaxID=696485 RepID=UPI000584873C|nr:hypothetical protein [Vibrio owensii]KIF47742.1 hypothetical protein M445_12195 [Vibrio owensii 47666-1]